MSSPMPNNLSTVNGALRWVWEEEHHEKLGTATAASKKTSGNATNVKFSHEETRPAGMFGTLATYRYYDGSDKASAMAFLQKNPVTKPSFFLVVKTPDGVFCRDIQGFLNSNIYRRKNLLDRLGRE